MTELTTLEYGLAWLFGALSLGLFVLTKKAVPMAPFQKLMVKFDLEQELQHFGAYARAKGRLADLTHLESEVEEAGGARAQQEAWAAEEPQGDDG